MFRAKAIVPKRRLDARQVEQAIERGYRGAAENGMNIFKGITRNWKHKPDVSITYNRGIPTITVEGDIFGYVDLGTPAHDITPNAGGFLRFRTGFTPKTTPNTLASGSGGSFGPYVSLKRPVKHPGTKARNFSKEVKKRMDERLPGYVRSELRKVLP